MDGSTSLANFASPVGNYDRDLRFLQLFEAAAIGIALCHLDGRIFEGNSTLARLLGYDTDQLTGLDPWKLQQTDSGAAGTLAELIRGERGFLIIDRFLKRSDGSLLTGRLTASLARDAQNHPGFLIVLLEDLTEYARLEQQLRQAEKMELIGRLATGVTHDFNNLLTGFLIYCDLLLAKLDPADPLHRHVEEMRQAGEQGSALTQQLLSITRKNAQPPRPISLDQVISSSEDLLRRLIGEHIELIVALDAGLRCVLADPAQIRQILLNLALNSRDAIRQGGRIHVRTRVTEFPARSRTHICRRALSLVVEDNGRGMSAETRAHIFEPFFTTKKPGEGTGMGLATVSRIVAEAGGEIDVASEPNRGTRIEIFFPICENQPPVAKRPSASAPDVPAPQSQNCTGDFSC